MSFYSNGSMNLMKSKLATNLFRGDLPGFSLRKVIGSSSYMRTLNGTASKSIFEQMKFMTTILSGMSSGISEVA